MTLVNAVLAALLATAALAAEPQRRPTAHNNGLVSWAEVIECYRSPQTAIQCLETRMGRSLVSLRDTAVGMARSDPDTATEDIAGVGDLVQQIGEFISYSLATYFHSEEDDTAAGVASSDGTANANGGQMDGEEGRGHHKKKKIQKEIKKFVLKILFGIYLFKQKIKMILMSIQSILMSKFLIVAMIYALSNTFKIWYDIKTEKHHHHDKVVYYENAHHQHHYEPPEHSEYDDHHHHGWGDWGRSIAVTEIPGNDPNIGVIGQQEAGVSRFIRRVSRTPQPMAEAQTMAFNAQRPSLE